MIQSLKQIKNRIRSTENTQRVTRAMELVSVAKLNRIEKSIFTLRPYVAGLAKLMQGLMYSQPPGAHVLFESGVATAKICLFLITSDSGLCSLYNSNIIRLADAFIRAHGAHKISLVCLGRKGFNYCKKNNLDVLNAYIGLNGRYAQDVISRITDNLVDIFISGQASQVYVAYTHFKTALVHQPTLEKFLNIELLPQEETGYILEPDILTILNAVVPKYIYLKFRLMILEAFTAEHSARAVAMKMATDNAKDLLQNLILWRNKVRQANITREIMEIISSSEALKG